MPFFSQQYLPCLTLASTSSEGVKHLSIKVVLITYFFVSSRVIFLFKHFVTSCLLASFALRFACRPDVFTPYPSGVA